MKRFIISFIAVFSASVLLCGCNFTDASNYTFDQNPKEEYFEVVSEESGYAIVYDTDTKVMYVMATFSGNYGDFTMLVNPDGSPKLYKED